LHIFGSEGGAPLFFGGGVQGGRLRGTGRCQ
jgi:hypothetical protein